MKDFDPQKLFIGVIDLFSILLPGALLTFLVRGWLGRVVLGPGGPAGLHGAEAWLAFLVSSYLLGHFVFLLGAAVLDDYIYQPVRDASRAQQLEGLAKGRRLSPRWLRSLADWIVKPGADEAVRRAAAIKDHYLEPLAASGAVNAFQWCKARLSAQSPEGLAAVQRFEADSKFFRSLVVLLCLVIPVAAFKRPALAGLGVPLLVLALWRYIDQRLKATTQAYWYLIAMEAAADDGYRQAPTSPEGPTHGGGVVYRHHGGAPEYLLVRASRAPGERVLPKGHIEAGESPPETAVREVREEAGAWARVEAPLDDVVIEPPGSAPSLVRFYLMEALEPPPDADPEDERWQGEPGRDPAWLPLEKAMAAATHEESRRLLWAAEERRADLERRRPPPRMRWWRRSRPRRQKRKTLSPWARP